MPMNVSSTTTTTATAATTAATDPVAAPKKSMAAGLLGKDDFLKLLVGQMKNQDPMNAEGGSTEQIAQMTQYAMLEQITNLGTTVKEALDADRAAQGVGLIGMSVSYAQGGTKDDPLAAGSGVVEQVTFVDGKPVLTVAGTTGVDMARVAQVSAPSVATPPATA